MQIIQKGVQHRARVYGVQGCRVKREGMKVDFGEMGG